MSEVSNVVKHSYHCRAANVSERSEPNNRVLFEILLGIYIYKYIHICIYIYIYIYIYMSAPYTSRCYSCKSLMAALCTEWHIALLLSEFVNYTA